MSKRQRPSSPGSPGSESDGGGIISFFGNVRRFMKKQKRVPEPSAAAVEAANFVQNISMDIDFRYGGKFLSLETREKLENEFIHPFLNSLDIISKDILLQSFFQDNQIFLKTMWKSETIDEQHFDNKAKKMIASTIGTNQEMVDTIQTLIDRTEALKNNYKTVFRTMLYFFSL